MANLAPKTSIYAGRVAGGFDIPIVHGVEGTSQTYKAGAPLIPSSGALVESTSPIDPTNKTVGFALADATGTTSHDAPYVEAIGEMLFIGYLQATSGSNATDTHTLAQTDVGTTHAIAKDAGGKWYVDFSDTSDHGCTIVALVDAIGTVGRVLFRVNSQATPYSTT